MQGKLAMNEWIDIAVQKPTQRGFYLVCGEHPFSSWAWLVHQDRFPDHLAYVFFDGNTFNATDVSFWMPNPEKPEGFDKRVELAKERESWPSWKQSIYRNKSLDEFKKVYCNFGECDKSDCRAKTKQINDSYCKYCQTILDITEHNNATGKKNC
jgi:hypothetical protein